MLFRKYRKIQKNRPGRGEKKCIFAVRIHSNSFILKHFLYWFPFLVSAYSPDFFLRLRRFLFFLFPCFGLSDPRFFPYSPEIPIFSGLFPRIRWPTPTPTGHGHPPGGPAGRGSWEICATARVFNFKMANPTGSQQFNYFYDLEKSEGERTLFTRRSTDSLK